MSETLLEARNLTKLYSSGSIFRRRVVKAVDDVSFSISKDKATITTLAGESGSGKSTIAKILLGLIPPTSGQLLYNGMDIFKMNKDEMRAYRKEVQTIFQDPYAAYNPFYAVEHILSVPIKKFKLAGSRSEEKKIIEDAVQAVNLSPQIVTKYPHELSGGERQRIMIARALVMQPKLIIADEPVSMIDASLRAGILNSILELKDKHGVSFIYITHDLSTAYYLSDNILVLYRGSVVEAGDVETVIKNPKHPYLKQLITAIPIPDPEDRWKNRVALKTEEITYRVGETCCKYRGRCPEISEGSCEDKVPPLVLAEPNHYVACHAIKQHENK